MHKKNILNNTRFYLYQRKNALPCEFKIFIGFGNRQENSPEQFIVSKPKKLHFFKSTMILSQLILAFFAALIPQ